jgi:hypothetical protein
MASANPFSLAIRSNTRSIRSPPSDVSTSIRRILPGAIVHDSQHPNHVPAAHAIGDCRNDLSHRNVLHATGCAFEPNRSTTGVKSGGFDLHWHLFPHAG